jgi:hypothetical protein
MSIVSNHFPELLDGLGGPEPWFGRPLDEPTEADWQDYEAYLDSLPEPDVEVEVAEAAAVERYLRAMQEEPPF